MKSADIRSLFCITGSSSKGLGHLERSITFAKALRDALGKLDLLFTLSDNPVLLERLERENIPHRKYPLRISPSEYISFLKQTSASYRPDLVVSDQQDTSLHVMHTFLSAQALTISFDDLGEGGYISNILIDANREKSGRLKFPSPVEKYRKTYQTDQTQLFGPDYVLLKPQFLEYRKKTGVPGLKIKNILISMGGGDSAGSTVKTIRALNTYGSGETKIHLIVIVGAAFSPHDELNEVLSVSKNTWEMHLNTSNMAKHLAKADLAITAGGLTLYEAASLGIPSIVLCAAMHQIPIATRLEKHGVTMCLGMNEQIGEDDIIRSFSIISKNWEKRIVMSQKGKAMVDCKGLFRIVETTISKLSEMFPEKKIPPYSGEKFIRPTN